VSLNYNNGGFHVNGNNNFDNDNNGQARRMALASKAFNMKRYGNLFNQFCSYDNLFLAYKKARKHKTTKSYVAEFEKNLKDNLLLLRTELLLHAYRPMPLTNFIVRDPKTRKISKSDFRDRVVHHALCNIIEPILDKTFIYDSYANRKGKGSIKALQRFDYFKRIVSKNNTSSCYILKADIKKYFENVDQQVLIGIIKNRIKDKNIICLIKLILANYNKEGQKGMPLGNLTSQFFANVYLNELDYFVKHDLEVECYIRYVDDFVILHNNGKMLQEYQQKIDKFLKGNLKIELHPEKSRILSLNEGIGFLGFRVFYHYKLLKKSNIKKMKRTLDKFFVSYSQGGGHYDKIYESFQGWFAYAKHAQTYELRKNLYKNIEAHFPNEISSIEIDRWLKNI